MKKFKIFLILMLATFMSVTSVNADTSDYYVSSAKLSSSNSNVNANYGVVTRGGLSYYYFENNSFKSPEYNTFSLILKGNTVDFYNLDNYKYMYLTVGAFYINPGSLTASVDEQKIACLPYSSNNYNWSNGNDESGYDTTMNFVTFQCDLGGLLSSEDNSTNLDLYFNFNWSNPWQYSDAVNFGTIYLNRNVYFTLNDDSTEILKEIEKQNQQIINEQKSTNNKLDDLNDNITSSDTTESSSTANSFFEGFDTDDYGLSDIVTMPLELIRGLTSNSCVSLSLTLPFVNKTFELPCMSSIYEEYFGSFYDLYQLITFGFISYWVIVRIFNLVKDFKNPDHDEIEVLDL